MLDALEMTPHQKFEYAAVQACLRHTKKYNAWKDSEVEPIQLPEPDEMELRKELLALADELGRVSFVQWWMENKDGVREASRQVPEKDWYTTEYELLFWQAHHIAKICISPFVDDVK